MSNGSFSISDNLDLHMNYPMPSLCQSCLNKREIRNRRGSVFLLCEKSKFDPLYTKYPPQPVIACPGFTPMQPNPSESGL